MTYRRKVIIRWVSRAWMVGGVLLAAPAIVGSATADPTGSGQPSTDLGRPAGEGVPCAGADYSGPYATGINVQDFEKELEELTAVGGQGFTLPKRCRADSIFVVGAETVPGFADTLNVRVYRADQRGLPDETELVCEEHMPQGAKGPTFDVPFRCNLPKGEYVLVVNVTRGFLDYDQWLWSMTEGRGWRDAAYRNPGGGQYGGACVSWTRVDECTGTERMHFIFALRERTWQ